jgi:hypothetical protein
VRGVCRGSLKRHFEPGGQSPSGRGAGLTLCRNVHAAIAGLSARQPTVLWVGVSLLYVLMMCLWHLAAMAYPVGVLSVWSCQLPGRWHARGVVSSTLWRMHICQVVGWSDTVGAVLGGWLYMVEAVSWCCQRYLMSLVDVCKLCRDGSRSMWMLRCGAASVEHPVCRRVHR